VKKVEKLPRGGTKETLSHRGIVRSVAHKRRETPDRRMVSGKPKKTGQF
jgi:hypothetical protein